MISAKNVFSDLYYSVTFHNFSLLSVNAALIIKYIIACSKILKMDSILAPTNQAIKKNIWFLNI